LRIDETGQVEVGPGWRDLASSWHIGITAIADSGTVDSSHTSSSSLGVPDAECDLSSRPLKRKPKRGSELRLHLRHRVRGESAQTVAEVIPGQDRGVVTKNRSLRRFAISEKHGARESGELDELVDREDDDVLVAVVAKIA
jgi:hypothetical protein